MNKTPITTVFGALSLLAGPAFAASVSCEMKASEKKLAGASRASYIKKCVADGSVAKRK